MPDFPEKPKENPSAYFVQDRSNAEELARLEVQDKMLTTGMGGVLPELEDPTVLQSILDVGCGTGGWLMDIAKTYPTIETLIGGDISGKMLGYARAQAESLGIDERVQFQPMDALRVLEFPPSSFDLVNQRAGLSWLRTWEWKKLLLEYQRVTRPGGIIRITECDQIIESNSPALTKFSYMWLEVNYNSGRLFSKTSDGVTGALVGLMTQYKIEDVQERVYPMVYRAGEVSGQYLYEDMSRAFRVSLPFFQKWIKVPSDYQEIYQQALKEMRQPDFVATWTWRTAWGTRSERGGIIRLRGLP